MMIAPECYLENINFEKLDSKKKSNYIRYAKSQVTHYQKLMKDVEELEIIVDPSPAVHQWWWKQVLDKMLLITTIQKVTN